MSTDSISEISPPHLRAGLMSGFQTLIQVSALTGFWSAFAFNSLLLDTSIYQWQLPVAVQLLPSVLMLLGLFAIPETPRFYAEKGEWERAETSLAWLRGLPKDDSEVKAELANIKETIEMAEKLAARHSESFFSEIRKPGIRNRLGVGVGLMIAQNSVGLNAINFCEQMLRNDALDGS